MDGNSEGSQHFLVGCELYSVVVLAMFSSLCCHAVSVHLSLWVSVTFQYCDRQANCIGIIFFAARSCVINESTEDIWSLMQISKAV